MARPDDWKEVRDLRLSALSQAPEVFNAAGELTYTEDSQWREHVRARVENGNVIFIARAGEKAVGMAGGKPNPFKPDSFVLHSLWVEPQARKAGVAKLLCAVRAAHARERGYRYVNACCKATNEPVLNFYRRLGYVEQPRPSEFRPAQAPHEILFFKEIALM